MNKGLVKIIGVGSYAPEKILTNADIEKIVDTSDEWIVTRSGIRERHIASDDEASSDLGTKAALKAISNAGIAASEIDLIITATITSDMIFPATACFIQKNLGLKNIAAFDINAACSGFIYALTIAEQFLKNDAFKTALVIGTEALSKIINWKDRATCVLLGDGAGAVVLRKEKGESGILGSFLSADGNYSHLLFMPGGGTRNPATMDTINRNLHYFTMSGNETFKVAVPKLYESAVEGLKRCGLTSDDITYFVPHQANIRIIQAVAKKLHVPMEKMFVNIGKYGNTSAATIPIALDEMNQAGMLKTGGIIELRGFGAGFTWGSCVIRW